MKSQWIEPGIVNNNIGLDSVIGRLVSKFLFQFNYMVFSMKQKAYAVTAIAVLTLAAVGCQDDSTRAQGSELESLDEKVSYMFGLRMGQQMQSQQIELDPDAVALAIRDVNEGAEPRLSDEEMETTMNAFQQEYEAKLAALQAEQQAQFEAAAAENKQAGEEFLKANAEKEGVVTLDSGLQYKVIEAGEGESPSATDVVTVHYRGTLLDGTVFDSSYDRGQPVSFPLQQVIAGWTEGLQYMAEGAKHELYIPSDLAYGPGGSGPIGPNETLIFEVELLDVEKPGDDQDDQQ